MSVRRDKAAELAAEQEYFDCAVEARERQRENLKNAHQAAAGPKAGASQVNKAAKQLLEKMAAPEDDVAFGRIDSTDGDTRYLGYRLISREDRGDPLVINWQLPIALPFWQATRADGRGLRRKRTFKTKNNHISDIDDVILAEVAKRFEEFTEQEELLVDDATIADLETRRTGEMADIVQTFHESQVPLLHLPMDRLLVIQGGPGTGKSAVALHRISVLLANNPELLADDFLVIGPNPTFTGYIKHLLPGLGDDGILHQDLKGLGPLRSGGRKEGIPVARLKGDAKMAEVLRRGLFARIGPTDQDHDFEVRVGAAVIRFGVGELTERLALLQRGRTYNAGRQALRAWIAEELDRRTASSQRLSADALDNVVERLWSQHTPQSFLWEFLASRTQITEAGGDDLTGTEIGLLLRPGAGKVTEEVWSDADVALLDELEFLMRGPGPSYAHLVVDEAQDLTPMQLRSVRRRSSRGSYTIVGDVAQSTGPWARDTWDDIVAGLQRDYDILHEYLPLGFRVPKQIFDLAERILPHTAPGVKVPTVVRDAKEDPRTLEVDVEDAVGVAIEQARDYLSRGRSVGIVCAREQHGLIADALHAADVQYDDADSGHIGGSINLVAAEESKGLEFDAVVVVEPALIARTQHGLRLLYIALTRATQLLSVVYSEPVPVLALGAESVLAPSPVEAQPSVASSDPVEQSPDSRPPVPKEPRPPRIQAIADELVEDIRSSVAPQAWAALIEEIANQLGVSDADN